MSEATKKTLLDEAKRYFSLVKEKFKPIVFETKTLASGASTTYDLTKLYTRYANYDLRSAQVTVLLLNKEAGQPTTNMYINSTASIVHGIDANGKVVITNFNTGSVDLLIRIDSPTVRV